MTDSSLGGPDGGSRDATTASLSVLLLRDQREQRVRSMERFADELERGLVENAGLAVRSTTIRASPLARLPVFGGLDPLVARNVRYPLAAGRRRADVFHIIDQAYGQLALALPRDRTIVTCHDLMLLRNDPWTPALGAGALTRMRYRWATSFLRRVAAVACPSEATAEDVHDLLGVPRQRLRVITQGVAATFRPTETVQAEPALRGASGRSIVLHVSTGQAYKNVPATLEVVAGLARGESDVALVRVGVPLSDSEREHAVRLNVADRIIELGHIPDEALVGIYNRADVLLFPSFWEGFGWPALEAMACGTPVVASNCAALRALIGDVGLLAAPTDVAALTVAVRSILVSPATATRLRNAGLERAAAFKWSRTATEYARLYDEVAASARPIRRLEAGRSV
ncbi:MAG: glycosyltransferase family 4 protein [Chloroflexota bacterium]